MGGLFNVEGTIFVFINKVVNIIFLSILWAIFSLPFITMGAATTALYYVTVKVIRKERGYIFREFWAAFKGNFKQSTIVWLLLVLLSFIFYIDTKYAELQEGVIGVLLNALFRGMGLIVIVTSVYLFPNISRFKIKTKDLFKNSLFMAIKHLPTTILLVAIVLICVAVIYGPCYIYWTSYAKELIDTEEFVAGFAGGIGTLIMCALFVPGVGCLIFSFFMEKILKKYMPTKSENVEYDEEGQEIIKDEWYLE